MLDRALAAKGFDVALYSSAEELMQSDRIGEAACLILDVDLPGISGLELQKVLNRAGHDVPVILISGQANENTRQCALSEGALAFFDKPFKIDSLLAAIRSVESLTLS
jgi:FixJ family two-component response regulator